MIKESKLIFGISQNTIFAHDFPWKKCREVINALW